MPVVRQEQTGRERTLLWASQGPTEGRALVEATAQEFNLSVRFCAYSELWTQAARADLVAIEIDANPNDAIGLIKGLHERLPQITLFAVSTDASVRTLRAALEAGASDFLSLPLHAQELHKALIKWAKAAALSTAAGGLGDIISIYGVRGGLGATTIAVNLAVRIASVIGSHVALVDLDLQRGDVAAFLNLTPAQSLAALAAAPGEVDEVFLYGTLTRHPSGVFVLPAPPEIDEAEGVGHGEIERALGLLRARFRYTVVDTARTLTDVTLAAFELSTRILLLTDLSVPGVRAARRTIELLGRLDVPRERVELLVTHAIPGPVTMEDAVRSIGKQPLLIVPRDAAAAAGAMNAGAPLNGTRASSLSIAISELAARLTGAAVRKAGGGRLFRRIFGRGGSRPHGTA
jgi:pilus assembly protein CpaE